MMKTKSLFVKVIISVAILSLGIIIGKYLPLIKFEKPKIKQYEYLGKINTGSKAPIKPLPYNISNDNAVNRSGVVTNAATAYKISNTIFYSKKIILTAYKFQKITPFFSGKNFWKILYSFLEFLESQKLFISSKFIVFQKIERRTRFFICK